MEFKITLILYETNFDWIEDTLKKIYFTLRLKERPPHADDCEYGNFLKNKISKNLFYSFILIQKLSVET